MTTKVYYNEWDSYAAEWLRNLIKEGNLPDGDVDERSITEVQPDDLKEYTQHHFFAGIGGWPLAVRLAGVSESERIVTGSPPCQPFSTAGQRKGYSDERHLAPHWLKLVAAIRPTWVFGEQVAAAIRKDDWLDDLLDALEAEGYATGAIVLPACSVGSPHIRQRLWVTAWLADSRYTEPGSFKKSYGKNQKIWSTKTDDTTRRGEHSRLENTSASRPRHQSGKARDEARRGLDGQQSRLRQRDGSVSPDWIDSTSSGQLDRVVNSSDSQCEAGRLPSGVHKELNAARNTSPLFGFYGTEPSGGDGARLRSERASSIEAGWNDTDWLYCRDGKWRPVESGTFPLANGVPGRVGRLRAYGNAIVPQVAAEVIKGAIGEY